MVKINTKSIKWVWVVYLSNAVLHFLPTAQRTWGRQKTVWRATCGPRVIGLHIPGLDEMVIHFVLFGFIVTNRRLVQSPIEYICCHCSSRLGGSCCPCGQLYRRGQSGCSNGGTPRSIRLIDNIQYLLMAFFMGISSGRISMWSATSSAANSSRLSRSLTLSCLIVHLMSIMCFIRSVQPAAFTLVAEAFSSWFRIGKQCPAFILVLFGGVHKNGW